MAVDRTLWGGDHVILRERSFCIVSVKGRMPALNRGMWATFVGSKIAEAAGVQELGWTFSQVIPIPSDKVTLSQPGPDLLYYGLYQLGILL